jgi:hypothetical protein
VGKDRTDEGHRPHPQRNITELPVIVSMYYDARVQPKMQLQAPNGRYAIQAIRNVLELNAVMELTCLAIAGAE